MLLGWCVSGVNSGMGVLARCMLSHEHQRTVLRLSGDAGGEGVDCGADSAHSVVADVLGRCVCVCVCCVVGRHCPQLVCAKIVPVCPHVREYSIVEKDFRHTIKIEST